MNTTNQNNLQIINTANRKLTKHLTKLQYLVDKDPSKLNRVKAWGVMALADMYCHVQAQSLKALVPWVKSMELQDHEIRRQAWTGAEPYPDSPDEFTVWYRFEVAIAQMEQVSAELCELHQGMCRRKWKKQHHVALSDVVVVLDEAQFQLDNVLRITACNIGTVAASGETEEVAHG